MIDRLVIKSGDDMRSRISESIETSLMLSNGLVEIENIESKSLHFFFKLFLFTMWIFNT